MSSKWCLAAVLLFAVSSQGQESKFNFRQASGDAGVRGAFATFVGMLEQEKKNLERLVGEPSLQPVTAQFTRMCVELEFPDSENSSKGHCGFLVRTV